MRISDWSSDVCSSDLVLHTVDWKLDEEAILGVPATAAALTAVGDEGIDVLVCDSTNAFNPEASGSEGGLRAGLEQAVGAAKGRVVVTTFASNAARLATLGAVAKATGRTIGRAACGERGGQYV